jgi:hypothetical protein
VNALKMFDVLRNDMVLTTMDNVLLTIKDKVIAIING